MNTAAPFPLRLGRYALYDEIAAGGMATVHLARLVGPVGFARTVAIKRLHPQHAKDPEFVAMFLDEARLAARIRHPNVVATLDVVATSGEVFLVMEYVEGESLASLLTLITRSNDKVPLQMAAHVMSGALHGLHAAHEARDEHGERLNLVHRDVSPHNILVGADGVPRVLDFGVAKAAGRLQTTDEGRIKGKMAYMAPEQLASTGVSPRTDVFAASIVLWEMLTGRRLFRGADPAEIVGKVLNAPIEAPSKHASDIPEAIDAIVLKGLSRRPDERWASAEEMATALEKAAGLVSPREVGEWVKRCAGARLGERAGRVAEIERSSRDLELAPMSARQVLESAIETEEAVAPVSGSVGAGGTGRSQVASVLDPRQSLLPRSRAKRWVPLLGGAALVLGVIVASALALRSGAEPASASGETPSAVPPAAPASAAAAAQPSEPAEAPPSASAEPTAAAGAAPTPSAGVTDAGAPTAVPKAARAKPATEALPVAPAGKPKKPGKDSLYSRD